MRTVLITGGSGFLGINLIRHLRAKGIDRIRVLDIADFDYPEKNEPWIEFTKGDVRDLKTVEACVDGCDFVVNTAAALPLYPPEDIRTTEVDGARNCIAACRSRGVRRMIQISSTAVYGVPKHHPIYETDQLVGVGPYGHAKIEAEEICRAARAEGFCVPVIRPKSFIGPERLGVFALFYDWAYTGHGFPMIGSGNNRYQLMDVEDLCDAIWLTATLPDETVNTEFNIGATEFTTMKEDYQAVLDRAGHGKKIHGLPVKPIVFILRILEALKLSPLYPWVYETASTDSFVSVEKAQKLLGFAPKFSNKEALVRNYEWYCAHLNEFAGKTGVSHRVPWKQGLLACAKWFFMAVAMPAMLQAAPEVEVGDARVGFTLDTGVWRKSKKAKAPDGIGSPRALAPAASITCGQMKSLSATTNGNVVTATWKGHPECGDGFTVTAKMRLLDGHAGCETLPGGFEYIGFEYSGNESGRFIRRISFPEVTVPRTDATAIFRPNTVGEVFRPEWRKFGSGKDVSTSGANWLSFGCIAALNDGAMSHFLDQRGEARLHTVALAVAQGAGPDTLVMCNRYAPPVTDALRKAGSLPYSGVYAPYRGGWYEAAKMHRAWLEGTPWFRKAAARDFSKLREIDLWMWSRGGIEVSEPPVHWFMKETGLKVALDWYWWHGIPYDTSFPYFWPPRDGIDNFRAAVKRMRDRGAFVQVYTNGASWDCDDPRWEDGGMESAILLANGGPFAKMYNVFTRHRLARICGEAPKFQAIIRRLERNLRESGLDGVYMDQISCGAHSPCYNPRHSHAPGGDAVEKGYREYVQAVRDDNPGFILSSESTTETYFDLFEASILLYSSWERCGKGSLPRSEPVPAVTVMYRGAEVIFGSFATPGGAPAWDPMWGKKPDGDEVEAVVAKYPDQFAVEFARGIVWGIQPMVHNFTMKDVANPRLAEDLQFMKDSARFYHDRRDFLFDGELLKPATLRCAEKRVEFLSASCYKRVKDSSTFVQKALPTVFHSEWRAKDGRKAAVLVNWTREEQRCELDFGGKRSVHSLPARAWRLVEL